MQMAHATASSVPKAKIPVQMAATLSVAENRPQMKSIRVALAAWKIEPEVDMTIWMPTERARIRNAGTDGIHWPPKMISTSSSAVNHSTAERGSPMKASRRMTFIYDAPSFFRSSCMWAKTGCMTGEMTKAMFCRGIIIRRYDLS